MKSVRYTVYSWMKSQQDPQNEQWINLGVVEDKSEETANAAKNAAEKITGLSLFRLNAEVDSDRLEEIWVDQDNRCSHYFGIKND